MTTFRVAVLTVSDTAALDPTTDKSGPSIRSLVDAHPRFSTVHHLIIPDEVPTIQSAVTDCVKRGDIDWIITTGGTGFGVRDLTPEAIRPLLQREASGLVHLLISESLKHTPFAALSRPVAGTIAHTLVVTLPGSVRAVRENLDALFNAGMVEHALDLINGGNGQQIHTKLATAATAARAPALENEFHRPNSHHDCGHAYRTPEQRSLLSHDPSAPVTARHRTSPYPLISMEEALDRIKVNLTTLGVETRPVNSLLKGYVLAVDVYAPQNVPPTATTSIDGYALRASDPPGIYKVITPQTHPLSEKLPPGTIFRINTGAPLPAGADTTIMVEDTRLISTFQDQGLGSEEKEVETLIQVPVGENVRAPGSDVQQGDLVLQKGEVITSVGGEVGTLAFVGRQEVQVFKKPVVAILSTGNEISDLHTPPMSSTESWRGIFDTNRPSLQAALEGMGYQVVDLGIVPDNVDAHVSAIKRGLEGADILLTTGGTSMGPADLLKPVIERNFNGTIHFGRVTVKPGKPTTFATIPFEWSGGKTSKPVFALPGNPASALVTFFVFVVPALRLLGGWSESSCQLPRVRVELQNSMSLDPRTEFHRVIIKAAQDKLQAFSTGGQRSSRVASLSGANGLVILPPKTKDSSPRLEKGTMIEALLIGEIQGLEM